MPGHFIVRVGTGSGVLVDPFGGGTRLTVDDCRRKVQSMSEGKLRWRAEFLRPTGVAVIAERVLHNLAGCYGRAQDEAGRFRVLTFLSALRPDEPENFLQRAEVAEELGVRDLAQRVYAEIVERFPRRSRRRPRSTGWPTATAAASRLPSSTDGGAAAPQGLRARRRPLGLQRLLKSPVEVAIAATREAGEVLLSHFGAIEPSSVVEKAKNDVVSRADQESEAVLRRVLLGAFPSDVFLGEETGMSAQTRRPRRGSATRSTGRPTSSAASRTSPSRSRGRRAVSWARSRSASSGTR